MITNRERVMRMAIMVIESYMAGKQDKEAAEECLEFLHKEVETYEEARRMREENELQV